MPWIESAATPGRRFARRTRRAAWIKGTRFAVRRRAGDLRPGDRTILEALESDNHDIYRAWLLVEQLWAVYEAATHEEAMALLDDWILAALTSEIDLFIRCALTIDTHRDPVVNAITERLSNARLEGMNSTVRLLSHRPVATAGSRRSWR